MIEVSRRYWKWSGNERVSWHIWPVPSGKVPSTVTGRIIRLTASIFPPISSEWRRSFAEPIYHNILPRDYLVNPLFLSRYTLHLVILYHIAGSLQHEQDLTYLAHGRPMLNPSFVEDYCWPRPREMHLINASMIQSAVLHDLHEIKRIFHISMCLISLEMTPMLALEC